MYSFSCMLVRLFLHLIFRIKIYGAENLPKSGGYILCSNHLSNWDPPVLQAFFRRPIRFMAKSELFDAFFVGFVMRCIRAIPVKRSGADLTAIKESFKTLKNGEILGIFPTGQRENVKGEGEVKPGIGLIAVKSGCDVIPVHITSTYRIFSKVIIDIGKGEKYSINEGEKLTPDVLERVSNEIYSKVKKLPGERK